MITYLEFQIHPLYHLFEFYTLNREHLAVISITHHLQLPKLFYAYSYCRCIIE